MFSTGVFGLTAEKQLARVRAQEAEFRRYRQAQSDVLHARDCPPTLDATLQSAVNWHLDRGDYDEAFRVVHGPWGGA